MNKSLIKSPLSEEVLIRDLNDNLIYRRYFNGDEVWFTPNGTSINRKYSNGAEAFWAHNSRGSVVYYSDNKGTEIWYDGNGNRICDNNKGMSGIILMMKMVNLVILQIKTVIRSIIMKMKISKN